MKNKKNIKIKNKKSLTIEITIFVIAIAILLGIILVRNKVTPRNYENIDRSMSYQEIVKLLGEPDDSIKQSAGTQYYWFDGAKNIKNADEKIEKGKDVYYITVYFIDEKVISYRDGYWYNFRNPQK